MSSTPKTIQIFLPSGDPRGIRIAEITTRIVQAIEVPRPLLGDFLAMPESVQVGWYVLVGTAADSDNPTVYIGQTSDLQNRLRTHHREKDFWQRAIIIISRTQSLTQTHAQFLEWFAIQEVRRIGRYTDENGNQGTRPHTPAPLEADCCEIFETAQVLLATLGHPLFEPIIQRIGAPNATREYLCTKRGANGRGYLTIDGFLVLQGSTANPDTVESLRGKTADRVRQDLLRSGIFVEGNGKLTLTRDHLFNSPSMAASVLLGRSTNGWTSWQTADGQTLDDLERQGGTP